MLLKIGSAAVVLAVALRVATLRRVCPLRSLPERLRRVRTLPGALRNPERLASTVDRLGLLLPPWGLGWCLKRSLLLLDLWSRCGLDVRLHVGVRWQHGTVLEGHAWIETPQLGSRGGAPAPIDGFVEAWVA